MLPYLLNFNTQIKRAKLSLSTGADQQRVGHLLAPSRWIPSEDGDMRGLHVRARGVGGRREVDRPGWLQQSAAGCSCCVGTRERCELQKLAVVSAWWMVWPAGQVGAERKGSKRRPFGSV
jgi:hypothetical protein